jgi:hypothetical protein
MHLSLYRELCYLPTDHEVVFTCLSLSTPEKSAGERRSRIHSLVNQQRESGDGMDATEMASSSSSPSDHKALRVSHLMSQYHQEDSGDYQDRGGEYQDMGRYQDGGGLYQNRKGYYQDREDPETEIHEYVSIRSRVSYIQGLPEFTCRYPQWGGQGHCKIQLVDFQSSMASNSR